MRSKRRVKVRVSEREIKGGLMKARVSEKEIKGGLMKARVSEGK